MGGTLEPGRIVAGRFALERCLGRGGMGEVWSAKHEVTRKRMALKFVRSDHLTEQHKRRFLREARAASSVEHPNVIAIRDVFELEDGTPLMVMDLLEGETLGERLEREEVLEVEELAELMLPVVSAVGTGHARGIVHRDLKPDNIFLASDGDLTRPVVLDFGIAKLTHAGSDDTATTADGQVLGTPSYMAPEQCLAEPTVDHRVDVWALGVIFYEALSGGRPIDGSSYAQVVRALMRSAIPPLQSCAPETPEDLRTLVMAMLAKDPADRPSLGEVYDVLAGHTDVEAPSFDAPRAEANASDEDAATVTSAAMVTSAARPEPASESPTTTPSQSSTSSNLGWLVAAVAAIALLIVWRSSSSSSTSVQNRGEASPTLPAPPTNAGSVSTASATPTPPTPTASTLTPPTRASTGTSASAPTPPALPARQPPRASAQPAATTAPSRTGLIESSPYD